MKCIRHYAKQLLCTALNMECVSVCLRHYWFFPDLFNLLALFFIVLTLISSGSISLVKFVILPPCCFQI